MSERAEAVPTDVVGSAGVAWFGLERESEDAMNKETFKRLMVPVFLLLLFMIPTLFWDAVIFQFGSELVRRSFWVGRYVFGICLWLTLAWCTIRLLDEVVWPMLIEQRLGYAIPRLLKDMVRLIVVVTVIAVIVSVVFEKSVTGFLAASGVVGLVLGLALQNMIADFFSGIALNLERGFTVGDRVRIENSDLTGDIVEINWRTTVILNFTGNYLVVPNSRMSSLQVENYHKPVRSHYNWHFLTLDFEVPVERAERVLMAALRHAVESFGVTATPIARVRLPKDHGMEYLVVYEVPEYRFRGRMRSAVMRSILHHFEVAGIRFAYPKQNIYRADLPLPDTEHRPNPHELLQRVQLFAALDASEIASLVSTMTPQLFSAGEAIVEQGTAGTSMYVVAEGLLYVFIEQAEADEPIKVADFIPGQFFGEMALLTGEPRTATVKAETQALVYEITKEDLEPLLNKRPEMAEQLAQIVAERRLNSQEALRHLPEDEQEEEVKNFASQLLNKMRGFFDVFRRAVVSRDDISDFSEDDREQ